MMITFIPILFLDLFLQVLPFDVSGSSAILNVYKNSMISKNVI